MGKRKKAGRLFPLPRGWESLPRRPAEPWETVNDSVACAAFRNDAVSKGLFKPCVRKERSTKDLVSFAVMILPQVHLRKPCYDFYFL